MASGKDLIIIDSLIYQDVNNNNPIVKTLMMDFKKVCHSPLTKLIVMADSESSLTKKSYLRYAEDNIILNKIVIDTLNEDTFDSIKDTL